LAGEVAGVVVDLLVKHQFGGLVGAFVGTGVGLAVLAVDGDAG